MGGRALRSRGYARAGTAPSSEAIRAGAATERRVCNEHDNQPLLGASAEIEGLWFAEAPWVTHAARAARSLVRLMSPSSAAIEGLDALRLDRLSGHRSDDLTASALHLYRDIYATAALTG
jgi:hypothetical protein